MNEIFLIILSIIIIWDYIVPATLAFIGYIMVALKYYKANKINAPLYEIILVVIMAIVIPIVPVVNISWLKYIEDENDISINTFSWYNSILYKIATFKVKI